MLVRLSFEDSFKLVLLNWALLGTVSSRAALAAILISLALATEVGVGVVSLLSVGVVEPDLLSLVDS